MTIVMPRTSTCGDWRGTIIAIWLPSAGPAPSWSMITRRFCAIADAGTSAASIRNAMTEDFMLATRYAQVTRHFRFQFAK